MISNGRILSLSVKQDGDNDNIINNDISDAIDELNIPDFNKSDR
jgi:hypothetical protein